MLNRDDETNKGMNNFTLSTGLIRPDVNCLNSKRTYDANISKDLNMIGTSLLEDRSLTLFEAQLS